MLSVLHVGYVGGDQELKAAGGDLKFNCLELLEIANECAPPGGNSQGMGTVDDPITMAGIGAWHSAAKTPPLGQKHVYYNIGGQMIHRRCGRAEYNNYFADWGPVGTVKAKAAATQGWKHKDLRTDPNITSTSGASYPKIYARLKAEMGQHTLNPDDPSGGPVLARAVRSLLQNSTNVVTPAGAGLLAAAWFLAEVDRNPRSLLSGLMLLDFIEKGIKYGNSAQDEHIGSKPFTWEKVLWHPEMIDFHVSGGNAPDPNRKERDLYGKAVSLDNWGGKHPMAHTGSEQQGKQSPGIGGLTPVHQKEASMLIRWLYHKLKNQNPFGSLDWDAVRGGAAMDTKQFAKKQGYTTLDENSKQHRTAVETRNRKPEHNLLIVRIQAKQAIRGLIQSRMNSEDMQL